jgi:hypothetical protein
MAPNDSPTSSLVILFNSNRDDKQYQYFVATQGQWDFELSLDGPKTIPVGLATDPRISPVFDYDSSPNQLVIAGAVYDYTTPGSVAAVRIEPGFLPAENINSNITYWCGCPFVTIFNGEIFLSCTNDDADSLQANKGGRVVAPFSSTPSNWSTATIQSNMPEGGWSDKVLIYNTRIYNPNERGTWADCQYIYAIVTRPNAMQSALTDVDLFMLDINDVAGLFPSSGSTGVVWTQYTIKGLSIGIQDILSNADKPQPPAPLLLTGKDGQGNTVRYLYFFYMLLDDPQNIGYFATALAEDGSVIGPGNSDLQIAFSGKASPGGGNDYDVQLFGSYGAVAWNGRVWLVYHSTGDQFVWCSQPVPEDGVLDDGSWEAGSDFFKHAAPSGTWATVIEVPNDFLTAG